MEDRMISVIMPCYNAEKFIAEAIESVLVQTHHNWELIIINDGSTDRSEEVIKGYNDSRIKYHVQENKGQAAASNTGIRLAKGDYFKFLDADDLINSTHLESQLKRLIESGDTLSVSSCAWGRFYGKCKEEARFISEDVWKDLDSLDWVRTALMQRSDMMSAWLWLIPKELLVKAGGWDVRLSLNNDFEFSVRLLTNANKVFFTYEAKLYYRTFDGSLSSTKTKQTYLAALLSTKLGCQHLLVRDSTDAMKQLCSNRYQLWIYRIYPNYPGIVSLFQKEIDKLIKPNVTPDGGRVYLTMQKIVGWRLAKRIQLLFYSFGYLKLLNTRKKIEHSFYNNK